jgi:hypothetical protein
MAGRSFREMMGDEGLGNPGPFAPGAPSVQNVPGGRSIGDLPLGFRTGAPPQTILKSVQVNPFSAGKGATQIVDGSGPNRAVILTAPFVGFTIYVGSAGVKIGDLGLPPGLPYEIIIPGNQDLYANSDAPVF